MSPTLRQLSIFIALANELNFSRAAAQLFMSQQAVSSNIRLLENQLGASLFTRNTRSVTLTRAGETLLERVAPLVGELDLTMRATALEFGRGPTNLRIEMPPGGAGELMPLLVSVVAEVFPEVQLELLQTNWAKPFGGLENGQVDLSLLRMKPLAKNVQCALLFEEQTVVAVANNHPLCSREGIRIVDLLDEPFVVARHAESHWEDFWLLNDFRRSPVRIGARADSFTEELEAVAMGLGISLVPALVSRLYKRPDLRFLDVEDIPRTPMYLAWAADSPIADRFQQISDITQTRGGSVIATLGKPLDSSIHNPNL